jgi:hypothetical protein
VVRVSRKVGGLKAGAGNADKGARAITPPSHLLFVPYLASLFQQPQPVALEITYTDNHFPSHSSE